MHIGPRARVRASLVFVLTLVIATIASADEVHLDYGDRYSGRVVSLDKGTLKFDTGHGVVDVAWKNVTAIAITEPAMITVVGQPERGMTLLLAPDGSVALRYVDRPNDTPQPVTLPEIRAIRRPMPPYSLVGGANAGFLTASGNTEVDSLHLDGEIVARVHDNRYTANGTINQASDSGQETARNATGTLRYDRFLTRTFYVNGSSIFTHDNFRDLDLRTAVAVGVGVQALDNRRANLALEAGYGYVRENLHHQPDTRFHSARETVTANVFVVGKRVVLFHRQDGFVGFTDDNLFVQTRSGVRLGLVGGLVTTLQYDVDYDRAPAPGRKQTDTSLGVTFGYRF